jgi:hypothetical protein
MQLGDLSRQSKEMKNEEVWKFLLQRKEMTEEMKRTIQIKVNDTTICVRRFLQFL